MAERRSGGRRQRRPGDAGAALRHHGGRRSTSSSSASARRCAATVERERRPRMSAPAKITYTSAIGDLGRVPPPVRRGARRGRAAAAGARHPFYIGGEAVRPGCEPLVDRSPIDTALRARHVRCAGPADVDRAVTAARRGAAGLGAAALARAARHAPARGGAHPRAEVRAGRHHGARGGEEPARGDGRRRRSRPT